MEHRFISACILREASVLANGERDRTHGPGRSNFRMTAALWSAYLGIEVSPVDVALMFDLSKTARIKCGVPLRDHFVDKAGYSSIAGELSQPPEPEYAHAGEEVD